MIVQKYLVINDRGTVQIREREPRLAGNEVALFLYLNIPEGLFKRPILKATMKIPAEAVPKATITTAITDNLEKIIKESTGLTMHIGVVEHEESKED